MSIEQIENGHTVSTTTAQKNIGADGAVEKGTGEAMGNGTGASGAGEVISGDFNSLGSTERLIGYVRVSTELQTFQQQKDRLIAAGVPEQDIFADTISGKDRNRPALKEMLSFISRTRESIQVVIPSLDRLGRSTDDLKNLTAEITELGVSLRFLRENLTVSNHKDSSAMEKMIFGLFSLLAEFERELMLERQREGIAVARKKGRYVRKPKLNQHHIQQARQLIQAGVPKTRIAADFGITTATLYAALNGTGSYAEKSGVETEEKAGTDTDAESEDSLAA